MPADNVADTPPMNSEDASALLPRLRVIEDQPLSSRAAAFVQIHDRLQASLEGSLRDGHRDVGADAPGKHG
ncbi:MAG: hypothetical protein V4531_11495 [Actinomycetota bacterium]